MNGGPNAKSFRSQVKILFALTVGLNCAQTHLLWADSEQFIRGMSQRLDAARAKCVITQERNIVFGHGAPGPWVDVEADEADFGKEIFTEAGSDSKKASWQQWG